MGQPEEGSIYMIARLEKFKFQQQVVPGDQNYFVQQNLIEKKLNLAICGRKSESKKNLMAQKKSVL